MAFYWQSHILGFVYAAETNLPTVDCATLAWTFYTLHEDDVVNASCWNAIFISVSCTVHYSLLCWLLWSGSKNMQM